MFEGLLRGYLKDSEQGFVYRVLSEFVVHEFLKCCLTPAPGGELDLGTPKRARCGIYLTMGFGVVGFEFKEP